MSPQIVLQNLVHAKFAEIRARNPRFTFQALSKRLGIDYDTMIRFLSGHRRVSRPVAEKICERLPLDPQDRAELLRGYPRRLSSHRVARMKCMSEPRYVKLSMAQHREIREWHHYAILSLLKTKDFQSDAAWIAERLGLAKEEAAQALERLERMGLIRKNELGAWIRTAGQLRTTDDVPNPSLQWAHLQNLELARQVLLEAPVERRDFSSITMPVDPALLPKAKTLIRQFEDDLAELLTAAPGTEVYKLCVQLFPLTKTRNTQEAEPCDPE